jgi:hypothetical protein
MACHFYLSYSSIISKMNCIKSAKIEDGTMIHPRPDTFSYIRTLSSNDMVYVLCMPQDPPDHAEIAIKDTNLSQSILQVSSTCPIEYSPGTISGESFYGHCGDTKSGMRTWKYSKNHNTWFIVNWV